MIVDIMCKFKSITHQLHKTYPANFDNILTAIKLTYNAIRLYTYLNLKCLLNIQT